MKERKIRKYDNEFKVETVRLVLEKGVSAASVERDLGIAGGSISHWKRKLKEDANHPFPGKGRRRPQDEEMYQLKRDNEKLRRERDILKKAVAIFSENR